MVSVGRGFRLSPNEEAALIQKEKDRRRKQRLQQVRQQEKLFARQLRNAVSKKKQEEVEVLANQLQEGWLREQRSKVEALQKLYRCNLQSIGQGHKDASEQKPMHIERTISSICNNRKAQERYSVALENLHTEQDAQWQKENAHIMARHTALEAERIRAAKVAKLPPPEGRWNLDDDSPAIHTVKLTSEAGLSTTHYHVTAGYAEKATSHQQHDARLAASEEAERLKEEDEERSNEIKERHQKAVLRHKYAREKELLKQDYNHLMNELGQLEQMDRKRRQAIVASIPKQVFQPPHKRLEDRLEHQQNLEEAFEDMYMAKTDFAGDLTLALDPQPPASDHDLDLTRESTIDTDILEPLLTPSRRHPPTRAEPDEIHSDMAIPSEKRISPQAGGLITRDPVQFPVGADRQRDGSSGLIEDDRGVEEVHPPAKKILPRSEALGRLLQRIRGQQKEISSQHEISSSTMTTATSSSSHPSDLSQYPIENSRPNGLLPLPNAIPKQPADIGNTQQEKESYRHSQDSQTEEDADDGKGEMEDPRPDDQEEPILSGSPTLLHPLEKAALIRAKVDLQKQTEEQARLLARSQQQLMELRGHQEPRLLPSNETSDEDYVYHNLQYEASEGLQQEFHHIQETLVDQPPAGIQAEVQAPSSGTMHREPNTNYTATQPQGSLTSEWTLSDHSGTRSSSEPDDPVLQRIRLYQQRLLQQHSKKKQDISKVQKRLEQTTEHLLGQQKHMMYPVQQLQRTESPDDNKYPSVPSTSNHADISYLRRRLENITNTPTNTETAQEHESSQSTGYSYSHPEFPYLPHRQDSIIHTPTDKEFATAKPAANKYGTSQSTGYSFSHPEFPYVHRQNITRMPTENEFHTDKPTANKRDRSQSTDYSYSHPDVSYLHRQENITPTENEFVTAKPNIDKHTTSDNNSYSAAKQLLHDSLPSFQPSGHHEPREEPTTYTHYTNTNTSTTQPLNSQDGEPISEFYKEHHIRTKWLEEQQELLRKQREALLKHQEVQKRNLEETQIQLKAQLMRSNTSGFDTGGHVVNSSSTSIPSTYPMPISHHNELIALEEELTDQAKYNMISPAVGSNQPIPVGRRSVHFQDIDKESIINQRQKTYPPVSIPKVIPIDVKLNTHELSTIAEMDTPRNQSYSMFQDQSSLQFKPLVPEEASDTNTSDSQVHDESNWKTNDTGNNGESELEEGPLSLLPVYDKDVYSPQNKSQVNHSSKVSPQAVINISNPVIEQDFVVGGDAYSFVSLQEKSDYHDYTGIGQETLPHFKPHEFQSSTQNSDSLESSIPTSVHSAAKSSFTRGPAWKDLLAHPASNLTNFKSDSLLDGTVKDQRSRFDVSTFDSTETSRQLENISRELRQKLKSHRGAPNQTVLSEYTLDEGIERVNKSHIGQTDYPDDLSPSHRVPAALISQPLREYQDTHTPIIPRTEGVQRSRPDNILKEQFGSLHNSRDLIPRNVSRLHPLHDSQESDISGLGRRSNGGSRDNRITTDVSSELNSYSLQKESPAALFHRLQAELTRNASLSTYSLDTSKYPNTPSQYIPVPNTPVEASLSSYSMHPVEVTDEHGLEGVELKQSATELSQYSMYASGNFSKHASSKLSEHSFSPAGIPFDSKTQNTRRYENIEMVSRTSEDSTISSISTDRNERNPADVVDDFEHMFERLSLKPSNGTVAQDQHETNTCSNQDVSNQFFKLHETQETTGSISIGQDAHDVNYTTSSQRNNDDQSRNKDDLKGMLQAVIARRTLNNQGLQMFSDISFSQHSLSSEGPSFMSRDLSQMISSRTVSGLGQVSEEERIALPSGTMPMFIRKQPPLKSQSSMSEEQQIEQVRIHRYISQRKSPIISSSHIGGSSTESSESEQPVNRLTKLVQQSKQVRQHHQQQKEVDLKKLEQINEAYKKTEEKFTELLSQKKDESIGIMEEPDLTLVSIPDTTISEGPIWDASLSEGPISNIMSDNEMVSALSEGPLTTSQMRSFDQVTALSEGLLTDDDSRPLEPLSEGIIADYSGSAAAISEGLLTEDDSQHLEALSEGRIVDYSGSVLSEGLLTEGDSRPLEPLSEGQIMDYSTDVTRSKSLFIGYHSQPLEPLSEGQVMDYSTNVTGDDSQPLEPLSEGKMEDYSASVEDISESLLSFQKHESDVATPMPQSTGKNPHDDSTTTTSSFQSSDTSSSTGQSSLSLQEAFARHKKGFIFTSKQRQDGIMTRAQLPSTSTDKRVKQKKKKTTKNPRPKLDSTSSHNENSSNSASKAPPKMTQVKSKKSNKKPLGPKERKNSEKEKLQRNLRLYNQLEEVKTKKKEDERKKFYEENRRKMKAFHEKVQSHLKQRASQSKK